MFDLAEAGLPEVPALGMSRYRQVIAPIAGHRHADCIELGLPPYHYQLSCRLEKAKTLLSTTDIPITKLAFDLGFCASQHFSSHFKRAYGITPLDWRRQHRTSR